MSTKVRNMRGGREYKQGLRDLINQLPDRCTGIEVGSYAGESAEIFIASGRVSKLTCVDPWRGDENGEAEAVFDQVQARWMQITKVKATSEEAAPQFAPQSVDFVYIDACHGYEHVKADIALWRPKVRAGGILAGHDYTQKKEGFGVIRAVNEAFGGPTMVFQDTSWMIKFPSNTFEIITYVSQGFAGALQFTLPSWLKNASAERIVIYTDGPELQTMLGEIGQDERLEFRVFFPERSDDLAKSCLRKIQSLEDAYQQCRTKYFIWLDADVYCQANFKDVFFRMGKAEVAATRMFNNTKRGHGQINAGVLIFQHTPKLDWFFKDWRGTEAANRREGIKGNWSEQQAANHLVHEAFHGHREYYATPVSENLYNMEDDNHEDWLKRIRAHNPKLIHFKSRRWNDPKIVGEVMQALGSI